MGKGRRETVGGTTVIAVRPSLLWSLNCAKKLPGSITATRTAAAARTTAAARTAAAARTITTTQTTTANVTESWSHTITCHYRHLQPL